MGEHASISPSSQERRFNCPLSDVISRQLPHPPSSEYAREGTLCHEVSEKLLLGGVVDPDDYSAEMIETAKAYVAFCKGAEREVKALHTGQDAQSFPELKVIIDKGRDIWGTADFVLIYEDSSGDYKAKIIDLKYGKGKVVDSQDNAQLLCYGLGVKNTAKTRLNIDIKEVSINIYQPRIHYKNDWTLKDIKAFLAQYSGEGAHTYTSSRLEQFEQELYANVDFINKKAEELGDKALELITIDELNVGDWCAFCPVKYHGLCKALKKPVIDATNKKLKGILDKIDNLPKKKANKIEKIKDLKECGVLGINEILKLVALFKELKPIAGALEEYLKVELLKGSRLPHARLEPKRFSRVYIDDEAAVVRVLEDLGIEPYQVKKTLTPITQVERKLGRNALEPFGILVKERQVISESDLKVELDVDGVFGLFENRQEGLAFDVKRKLTKVTNGANDGKEEKK